MCRQTILTVRNFGPIENTEINIDKYTILIGPQGSGKSTLAKLFSVFTWMEKSLSLGVLTSKKVEQYSRFQKTYCKYHRMENFFEENTYIKYVGVSYDFLYEKGKFHIEGSYKESIHEVAKVMYVPAERGFLSTLGKFFNPKGLPDSMVAFWEGLKEAETFYGAGYDLPINGIRFEYDTLNDIAWLKGEGYRVNLSSSSSGYQSLLPMSIVTRYLSRLVSSKVVESRLNVQEQEQMKREVKKIMDNDKLSEDVKMAMLHTVSSRYRYSRFVNIVEEPEQNLYPESQMHVLHELLSVANEMDGNQLFLTTHSPYLIDFLTLSAKAFNVKKSMSGNEDTERLYSIVPQSALLDPMHLNVYEVKDGGAVPLATYEDGLPSDENVLNKTLAFSNKLYDDLLELEEVSERKQP